MLFMPLTQWSMLVVCKAPDLSGCCPTLHAHGTQTDVTSAQHQHGMLVYLTPLAGYSTS